MYNARVLLVSLGVLWQGLKKKRTAVLIEALIEAAKLLGDFVAAC
jgi:hypothetical protein